MDGVARYGTSFEVAKHAIGTSGVGWRAPASNLPQVEAWHLRQQLANPAAVPAGRPQPAVFCTPQAGATLPRLLREETGGH